MIKKNVQFGNTKEVTLVEFGKGTVRMVQGIYVDKEATDLTFTSMKEPHPMNVSFEHGFKDFDELKPEIVFQFSNTLSIDSLISMLENCKKDLLSK